MEKPSRLGRGLDALLPAHHDLNQKGERVIEVNVERLVPNPHQPRLVFKAQALEELSQSIKEHGILQPLVVQKRGSQFQIVVGERRFQAAKKAGKNVIPVIVRDFSDQQNLELAILENVQREQLSALEEAQAYQRLHDEFELEFKEIAQKLGKSPSTISNKVRLLRLPTEVQRALKEGEISEGHARALLQLDNEEHLIAYYLQIKRDQLNVRQLEQHIRQGDFPRTPEGNHRGERSISPWRHKEQQLSHHLSALVKIKDRSGKGHIQIRYDNEQQRETILSTLEGKK